MADVVLTALIFAAAVLYSAVGHAGSSGYQAAMALMGVEPAVMKPTALFLNVLVATLGTIRFARAGCFHWRLWWPFALGAVPFAFLGGRWDLPADVYKRLVGLVLLFAAYRLATFRKPTAPANEVEGVHLPPIPVGLFCGAAIGFLSGLTATGGGIFLSPLLILKRWADAKTTAGVSVAFILVNSIAGMAGNFRGVGDLPPLLPLWAVAAVAGSLVGTTLGLKRLDSLTFRRLLAFVLVTASFKLLM